MSVRNKVVAVLTASALSASALVGLSQISQAAVVDEPVINEFVTDEQGTDTYEFVEILIPEGFDTTELRILGVEGDSNNNQGNVVHNYDASGLDYDADGRGLLTVPQNGLQNGSLSLLLVRGNPGTNAVVDADRNGEIDADVNFEVLDAVGIHDGDNGDLAYGTELRASTFEGYTGALGGASRVPDGSDTWVPNAYNGAGLPGNTDQPRGDFEVASTPGEPNGEQPSEDPTETSTPTPTDQPTEVCQAEATPINQVQGEGTETPLKGQNVTVRGVVIGDFWNKSGGSNGFWIQSLPDDVDDNDQTSEGLFIHNPGHDAPENGTVVTVAGTAGEYYEQTQLSKTTVTECDTAELPEPVEITFPVEDDLEHLEGMRVNVAESVVLETYQFARFGEIVVGPERQYTPTAIHAPDSAEAEELYESNQANRITIDDRNSIQNVHPAMHPNGEPFTVDNIFRGGDQFNNITGVMDYRNNSWKIQRTEAAEHLAANPRDTEVPEVGGDIKVAAFNVLNYFTTFNERGARNEEEFQRQKEKLVTAIAKMDADVVGFMEIENNSDVALQNLVDGVNEYLGEKRYVAVETGKLGTDAITTAMMYKPDVVTPVGSHQVLDTSVDARFDTRRNRPALAQTFTINTEDGADNELGEFTVITNHLKSKGSECGNEADNTHLVGNCDPVRTEAAKALVDWSKDMPKPVIMGDLNAYDHENPITTLTDGGFVDLKKKYEGEYAYSYVFDGQLGYLDYALAHDSLEPFVTGAASWNINSDEVPILGYETRYNTDPAQSEIYEPNEFRSSDHDPVVFGLRLTATDEPTEEPTEDPTEEPTEEPTEVPTEDPTDGTGEPTEGTEEPTEGTEDPTEGTEEPTEGTEDPTEGTGEPTEVPTEAPTEGTEGPAEGTGEPTDATTEDSTEDTSDGAQDPSKDVDESTENQGDQVAGEDQSESDSDKGGALASTGAGVVAIMLLATGLVLAGILLTRRRAH